MSHSYLEHGQGSPQQGAACRLNSSCCSDDLEVPTPTIHDRNFSEGMTTSTTSTSTMGGPMSSFALSSPELLHAYNEKVRRFSEWEQEELLPALAHRSYHLPGHGYCSDLVQYFANTHPLFGMCCHHPMHPVRYVP